MMSAQILRLLAIAGDPGASANARIAARSEITALARAESQKDPLDEAKRALTAIVENKDATEDQRKAARKALALLAGKPADDDKTPVGRASAPSAAEIATAVAAALKPPPDFAQLTREHQARANASYRARLTPAQKVLLDRSAPRVEPVSAQIRGCEFVMPARVLSRAEAAARLTELDDEAGQ